MPYNIHYAKFVYQDPHKPDAFDLSCYEIDRRLGLLPVARVDVLEAAASGALEQQDYAAYLALKARLVERAMRHLEWRAEQLRLGGIL